MNQEYLDRVIELTNLERSKEGLPPLKISSMLAAAAQKHTEAMASKDFFSHTGIDNSDVSKRLELEGYQWSFCAENIYAGGTTPEEAVKGWMKSPGHRQNILNSDATEIGVGYYFLAEDTGEINYKYYWTQVFAAPL